MSENGWMHGIITIDGQEVAGHVKRTLSGLKIDAEGDINVGTRFRAFDQEWEVTVCDKKTLGRVLAECEPMGAAAPAADFGGEYGDPE